jgi:hypothetical protein
MGLDAMLTGIHGKKVALLEIWNMLRLPMTISGLKGHFLRAIPHPLIYIGIAK